MGRNAPSCITNSKRVGTFCTKTQSPHTSTGEENLKQPQLRRASSPERPTWVAGWVEGKVLPHQEEGEDQEGRPSAPCRAREGGAAVMSAPGDWESCDTGPWKEHGWGAVLFSCFPGRAGCFCFSHNVPTPIDLVIIRTQQSTPLAVKSEECIVWNIS